MEASKILALDLSLSCGWAHTSGDSGVFKLPTKRKEETNGARFNAFLRWLNDMCDLYVYHYVVYEMPHQRGGAATRLTIGMATVLEMHAEHLSLRACKRYHSATIKKHATGSGRADKPAMWEAAKARGMTKTPATDDEIDAKWLLDLALNDSEL